MLPQEEKVTVDGREIWVGDSKWMVEYPISDFAIFNDKVILIYEYMAMSKGWGQIKNMEAFDLSGRSLWIAQHPTNQHTDCYISFVSEEPLVAYNFAGFECRISPSNGKLLETIFTK